MSRRWFPLLLAAALLAGCSGPGRLVGPAAPPAPAEPAQPAEPPAPASLGGYPASVPSYAVEPGFRNVANWASFNKKLLITDAQKALLARNMFCCTPTQSEQLLFLYENNDYENLPSFVTVDLVLQLYHMFYDFTLRRIETDFLAARVRRLTERMLEESLETWVGARDPGLREAARRNAAFFGVAARLAGLSSSLPAEVRPMVARELALVQSHSGFAVGAIFPYKIDYSQFVPRGHYTRSEALRRYFLAMMWYGLVPFTPGPESDLLPIQQGLLLVRSLHAVSDARGKPLLEDWEGVYEPTVFYVGSADDLTPHEWKPLMDRVFGAGAPAEAFADRPRLEQFVAGLQHLRPPGIVAKLSFERPVPDPERQLRMMGQRYIPDSEVLQELCEPYVRPFPSGLDVMAVLGSRRAAALLDANPEFNPKGWPDYRPKRGKLLEQFAAIPRETWGSNLYWGWLDTLRALLEPVPTGYPSVMRTTAWQDRSLHTALASWTELRHDTILYAKQSVAECGDGEEKPFVKGYVEPNPLLYNRLRRLTRKSMEGLAKRGLLADDLIDKFEQVEELLDFLLRVSLKELQGEKLTREEYEEIRFIGGKVEYLTLSLFPNYPNNWSLVAEVDRRVALVADVHTAVPEVLEEAVGHAAEILAIVPIEGKLQLTRGAVFTHYEFRWPMNNRLTDEAWQRMLERGPRPRPAYWTKSFLAPARPRDRRREAREVYSSGC